MWRVTFVISRRDGVSTEAFQTRWLEVVAPAIVDFLRSSPALRKAVVNVAPADLDPKISSVFPKPYDGLFELWFDTPGDAVEVTARLEQADELAALARDVIDGERGVAWLAKAVPSKPEQGTRVKFLAGGDVAEGVPLEEAHRYWAEEHPVLARTSAPQVWEPLTRYMQFHGTPSPALSIGRWLATARFIPMCSDMGFADAGDFLKVYTSEQYATIVRPDEIKFSRPGEALAFVSTEERVLYDASLS